MDERPTQEVCQTDPVCLCHAGSDEYSCDCASGTDGACLHCDAEMILIYVDTGDPVC